MTSESGAIDFHGSGPTPVWFDPRRLYGQGPGFFMRGPGKWFLLVLVIVVFLVVTLCQSGVLEEQRDQRRPTATSSAG